jgi:hypothetical protein
VSRREEFGIGGFTPDWDNPHFPPAPHVEIPEHDYQRRLGKATEQLTTQLGKLAEHHQRDTDLINEVAERKQQGFTVHPYEDVYADVVSERRQKGEGVGPGFRARMVAFQHAKQYPTPHLRNPGAPERYQIHDVHVPHDLERLTRDLEDVEYRHGLGML